MKKQTVTFVFFCAVFLVIITIAGSFLPVPVSREQAITTFLNENYGQSKTAWLDTIETVQTAGTTVVVNSRKSRHNDAIEICEAVSRLIFAENAGLKPALQNIEVRNSGKVIAKRNGVNDHCG